MDILSILTPTCRPLKSFYVKISEKLSENTIGSPRIRKIDSIELRLFTKITLELQTNSFKKISPSLLPPLKANTNFHMPLLIYMLRA